MNLLRHSLVRALQTAALLLLGGSVSVAAQTANVNAADSSPVGPPAVNVAAADHAPALEFDAPQAQTTVTASTTSVPSPAPNANDNDNQWHFDVAPYLWFAGVHGTVGALGQSASVHATPGELLSHFDIGFMGLFDARYNHWLLSTDFLWMRLSQANALPENITGITSVKVKVTQSLLTPKVGYRVLDRNKMKVDAQAGIRYWYTGENLSFMPPGVILNNFSHSQSWVDVVAGARIDMPITSKWDITTSGDAGAGGANLDYQLVGLLAYQVKPKIGIDVGYRYLSVNYRPSNTYVYDVIMNGALIGVVFTLR